MTISGALQPDQQPDLWDHHVRLYEEVFEPFTDELAAMAIDALALSPASHVIDSGAGAGGAALTLARRGHRVTAVDASAQMVARTKERAVAEGVALDAQVIDAQVIDAQVIDAQVMDGQHLAFPDASFDAALSVFGVILFPDAAAGLAELRRVVKPGGRVALVTWTAPETYELVGEMRAAAASVLGELPMGTLPAQLRFKDRDEFQTLFDTAGLAEVTIDTIVATLKAPSPRWLAERVAFAPGMANMLAGFGQRSAEILYTFKARLEQRFADGPVELKATAFIGSARTPLAARDLTGK
jgi:ubiquinone/menaquinone biosynthesis C-methylase UbiE